jgi:hypothetical protein
MATVDKDFKVKNGLVVTNGGSFGGTVTVATPTLADHATTKQYVDDATGTVVVETGSVFPASPENGEIFYDTVTSHLYVFYNSAWTSIAMYNDTLELQQHIHDTAIDGTGLVVSILKDAGYYDEAGDSTDAGFYSTNAWTSTWDGGIAVDNFN